jgi:hypothetical protein
MPPPDTAEVPPYSPLFSISNAFRPRSWARSAAVMPPAPEPITNTSQHSSHLIPAAFMRSPLFSAHQAETATAGSSPGAVGLGIVRPVRRVFIVR